MEQGATEKASAATVRAAQPKAGGGGGLDDRSTVVTDRTNRLRALRAAFVLGAGFLLLSSLWDVFVAPTYLLRLLPVRIVGAAVLLGLVFGIPLVHRRRRALAAAGACAAAAAVCYAGAVLPYGVAYTIGGMLLLAMTLAFVSPDGRSASISAAAALASGVVATLIGAAPADSWAAFAFFIGPGLLGAAYFAHVSGQRASRSRVRRDALFRLRDDLARFGHNDELTGVFDKKQLQMLGRREVSLARRRKAALSALKIDVVALHDLSTKHGGAAADQALRAIASMCQANLRETDLLARVAHDAFAAVLPEADGAGAAIICERLRACLKKANIHGGAGVVEVSVNVEAATLTDADRDIDALIARATSARSA